MRAYIPKFIRAFAQYLLYYARLFPLYFSLELIGVCSGLLTAAALLGLMAMPRAFFYFLVLGTGLAYPLVPNAVIAILVYRQLRDDRSGVSQGRFSSSYRLDSTSIKALIDQFRQWWTPETGGCHCHIFETEQAGASLTHLAVWSPEVNRELLFDDDATSRWKFRVNKSLKWSRLNAISRDWMARRTLLMFHIFDGIRRGKIVSDDKKIGLSDTLVAGAGEVSLEVFPISFFDSLLTNGAAGRILVTPLLPRSIDFRQLFPIKGDTPALLQLSECTELANYIGISTLLISGDQQKILYIPRQSHLNQQSGGLLAPSGSGSLDWEDLAGSFARGDDVALTYSMRDTVVRGMERELREELQSSVDFDSGNSRLKTQIIGYFRVYERAGKPEFVGISVADAVHERSSSQQIPHEVHEMKKFSFSNIAEFKAVCMQLLQNRAGLSVPLRMSLLFLSSTMEDKEGERRLSEILRL